MARNYRHPSRNARRNSALTNFVLRTAPKPAILSPLIPHTMPLPHNAYTSALTLQQAVDEAISNPLCEVDLAASKHFWDFEDDIDPILTAYDSHFERIIDGLIQILGKPAYRGRWDTPGRVEWESVLPEFASAWHLVIWERDGKTVYCRIGQGDKEIPILIAFGVAGCQETGVVYPGQFE